LGSLPITSVARKIYGGFGLAAGAGGSDEDYAKAAWKTK
jgi:hypothetical protein